MNAMDQVWQRLAKAARRGAPAPATEPPPGFSHRVVARWRTATEAPPSELYAFFARRILAGAVVVLAGALAVNYVLLQGVWDVFSGASPLLEMVLAL